MLEKYYRINCSSGFAGEDTIRVLKLVGDDLEEIEQIVKNNYDELYYDAWVNAVNNLYSQAEFEDENELFEEASFYVSGNYDKITTTEFEKITNNAANDYDYKQNNISVYIWDL